MCRCAWGGGSGSRMLVMMVLMVMMVVTDLRAMVMVCAAV
jgi:hypothetical protein